MQYSLCRSRKRDIIREKCRTQRLPSRNLKKNYTVQQLIKCTYSFSWQLVGWVLRNLTNYSIDAVFLPVNKCVAIIRMAVKWKAFPLEGS